MDIGELASAPSRGLLDSCGTAAGAVPGESAVQAAFNNSRHGMLRAFRDLVAEGHAQADLATEIAATASGMDQLVRLAAARAA